MEHRKVAVYKYGTENGKIRYDKILDGRGVFHAWGIFYDSFAPVTFSTAIVEMPDGSVRNVPLDLIVFVEPIK